MSGGGNTPGEPTAATSPARRTDAGASSVAPLFVVGLTCEPALVELGAERVVLGRSPDCDIQLSGTEASRHHAEIVRAGPLHLLRDLGSANGTFVNGARTAEAPLTINTVVRMGDWLGIVAQSGADGARAGAFVEHGPQLWGGPTLGAALAPALAAARTSLPIVLEGETGTGKELVAQAVHAYSGRSGRFVAINCGALPETLVEGELFGYRRGAFTGADRANAGYFREADGGTLLLDEVCDLSPATQVKLLRVLEQREVVPLGESRPIAIDVRVIAAAQEPLQRAVEQQRFRADLYARLDGLSVRLPPLRERIADVPRLLTRFMADAGAGSVPELSVNALEVLCLYDWPLNVRELRHLGQRLAVLHRSGRAIGRGDLPERMRAPAGEPGTAGAASGPRADAGELDRLLDALRRHRGNVSKAARDAGISRNRAYRLMNANPDVELGSFRQSRPGDEP